MTTKRPKYIDMGDDPDGDLEDQIILAEHRAAPVQDARGALKCACCGRPVRQWSDGRFPIHAQP